MLSGDEGNGSEDGWRKSVEVEAHAGEAVQQLHAVMDALLVQAERSAQRHEQADRLPPLRPTVLLHYRLATQRVAFLKLLLAS